MMEFDRQDSRKRRRLSERRRVFSRIGLSGSRRLATGDGSLSSDKSWSSSSQQQQQQQQHQSANNQAIEDPMRQQSNSSRSDSPLGDGGKISMKIQFHITVAPEHEPIILDVASLGTNSSSKGQNQRNKSIESIGDQIHERLSRQNTMSTKRRQQLLAMHNKMALDGDGPRARANSARCERQDSSTARRLDNDDPATTNKPPGRTNLLLQPEFGSRDTSTRACTITAGISDEATVQFLAQHKSQGQETRPGSALETKLTIPSQVPMSRLEREHIYFKRDGQRFGHEFTLKLAVDRSYRCLLKVRPLIPLQSISIQGHHVLFADCSQSSSGGAAAANANTSAPSSAPASSSVLNRSWQDIRNQNHHQNNAIKHSHQQHSRLHHAQTTSNLSRSSLPAFNKVGVLYQQQQNQMMKYFAASHCSSSSNSHMGSQLFYMFDWSAGRFEVNKNKNRTQIQTVLKFKNGQILTLPLQVKFYQSECRQHLSWGSQLHFIDYDCNIDNLGQISVDRVQYY